MIQRISHYFAQLLASQGSFDQNWNCEWARGEPTMTMIVCMRCNVKLHKRQHKMKYCEWWSWYFSFWNAWDSPTQCVSWRDHLSSEKQQFSSFTRWITAATSTPRVLEWEMSGRRTMMTTLWHAGHFAQTFQLNSMPTIVHESVKTTKNMKHKLHRYFALFSSFSSNSFFFALLFCVV